MYKTLEGSLCQSTSDLTQVLVGEALILSPMDGLDLKVRVNSDAIKMFYV